MKEFNAAKPYIRAGVALLIFLCVRAAAPEEAFTVADEFMVAIENDLRVDE